MGRRQFGSVRRLPSGRRHARYWTPAGEEHTAPQTVASKGDAARFLARVQTEMERGEWRDPRLGRITFEWWVEECLAGAGHKRPTTRARDEVVLRTHFLPALGSPDGLEWRFTLRDNAKWQDGRPVTAEDVKFSFDYVTTGAAASISRLAPSLDLKEVVVESPNVVVVRLNKPTAVFEEDVAMRLFVIPQHIWSAVTDPAKFRDPKALIGSGPYKLESEDEAAGTYLYTANDSFYLVSPYVKRLELVPAPDELLALQRGDVDAGELLEDPAPEEQIKAFESNPAFTKLEGTYDWMLALHINLSKGFPYDCKEFRQAIAYGLDRKDMVARLLQGRGVPESVGGLTEGHPMLAPDLPTYDHDVAKAKSLLDGLGMKDINGDGLRELPDGSPNVVELQANNGSPPSPPSSSRSTSARSESTSASRSSTRPQPTTAPARATTPWP